MDRDIQNLIPEVLILVWDRFVTPRPGIYGVFCLQTRPRGGVTGHKVMFAQDHKPIDKLEDIVEAIKPTAIIGNI